MTAICKSQNVSVGRIAKKNWLGRAQDAQFLAVVLQIVLAPMVLSLAESWKKADTSSLRKAAADHFECTLHKLLWTVLADAKPVSMKATSTHAVPAAMGYPAFSFHE